MTKRQQRRIIAGVTADLLVTAREASQILGVTAKQVRDAGARRNEAGLRPYAPVSKNHSGAHLYHLSKVREALNVG